MNSEKTIKPIPIWLSILFFGIPTIASIITWNIGIPFFKSIGLPQNVSYMISMTLVLFPLLIASIIAFVLEGNRLTFKEFFIRFRLNPITKKDLLWILFCFIGISVFTSILQLMVTYIGNVTNWFEYSSMPPELGYRVLSENERWIFLVHAFYFICNILGEELLYRGYILPRQELTHRKYAWLINGALWTMVHLTVGLPVITMIPLMFLIPFVVQKQKNTWSGIIVHALIAGMGFYLIALGII